jgi:serine/threonine-protein kinase
MPPDGEMDANQCELTRLGDFRLLRRLGVGSTGLVYLGQQGTDEQMVAIKVLSDELAGNQDYIDRFYREARSGALLDHPNIVRAIVAGRDRVTGKHYLVLEYVDGPSAGDMLAHHGRIVVADALHIALDIARGLEHVHSRNVVHRDVKPDNILISRSGVAKLSDLGLAKRLDEASHLTGHRQGFGTPYYMPYEQATNAREADGRSDIYALGATVYHMVTGEVPFPGVNHLEVVEKKKLGFFAAASSVNPAVPGSLDAMLERMLARKRRHRYQTASELIVDLERSGLAAAVPSFVDLDLALRDPHMRARLTSPAQRTLPDLRAEPVSASRAESVAPSKNGASRLWYLRYRAWDGQWCKARATQAQIEQRLRDEPLADVIEATLDPQGEFKPLDSYPEFHAVLAAVGSPKRRTTHRRPRSTAIDATGVTPFRSYWLTLIGMGLLLAAAAVIYLVLTL